MVAPIVWCSRPHQEQADDEFPIPQCLRSTRQHRSRRRRHHRADGRPLRRGPDREALELLADLHRTFDGRRRELLEARQSATSSWPPAARWASCERDQGRPRGATGGSPPPAPGLVDRRVEITGPTDRKMTINALNSGAKVWLADFEDANTPLWANMVSGHLNLRDALDRTIDFSAAGGKAYKLAEASWPRSSSARAAGTCPRSTCLVDGEPMSGSLFDFGLYFFHCARRQLGQRPGSVLLPAEDGEPPRGPAVERRVRPRPGAARHPPGHDPGDRADRDLPGRVRDGGDPLRAARALRRAERRPLGLHVQRDQEVPHPGPRVPAARPQLR